MSLWQIFQLWAMQVRDWSCFRQSTMAKKSRDERELRGLGKYRRRLDKESKPRKPGKVLREPSKDRRPLNRDLGKSICDLRQAPFQLRQPGKHKRLPSKEPFKILDPQEPL
jgi:hypothetical protein